MRDFRIYIPTRERVGTQYSYEALTRAGLSPVLVCPAAEVQDHLDRGRKVLKRPPFALSAVRQWIIEQAIQAGEGKLPTFLVDDDLNFFVRRTPEAHNLRKASGGDIVEIFSFMADLMPPYIHGSLSARQGNNWLFPNQYVENYRMNAVHAVIPEALAHYGVRYDDVVLMEDYHVTLSLLASGEPNFHVTWAAWDQRTGSAASGGLTLVRTKKRQEEAAERLLTLHPRVTQPVTKAPKTGVNSFAGERKDVRVYWNTAARIGSVKKPTYER